MERAKPSEPSSTLTPYERFVAATRQVLSVSKEELERREKTWRNQQKRKRAASRNSPP